MDDSKPAFVPLHPKFTRKAKVNPVSLHNNKTYGDQVFSVNLFAGTCNCDPLMGRAFEWHDKQQCWVPNKYCSHKLRVMAEITEEAGRPTDMIVAYTKALATRYNQFEVVSAFHKELRRGDVEKALFWGSVLGAFRRPEGIVKYLFNIVYEETRDHWLAGYLMEIIKGGSFTPELINRCIYLFCTAKKKWELPTRLEVFQDEMAGYDRLIAVYGRDVAKGHFIIPTQAATKLWPKLLLGLKNKDAVVFHEGLKGLQKSKVPGIDPNSRKIVEHLTEHRANIANKLIEKLGAPSPNVTKFITFLEARAGNGLGIGYHELNTFGDLLMGEDYNAGLRPTAIRERDNAAKIPQLRLGIAPQIPKYAHDNHTYAGKAMLRAYPKEWLPGAEQEHFDLRLCGAYMGVGWRYLAYRQFKKIEDVPWGAVTWPKGLHETVSNLWY